MGKYTKHHTHTLWADGWEIRNSRGDVLAALTTERLADVLLCWLTGGWPRNTLPDFAEAQPYADGGRDAAGARSDARPT